MCPEAFFQDKSGEIAAIHMDRWKFVVDDPSMRAHSRKAGLHVRMPSLYRHSFRPHPASTRNLLPLGIRDLTNVILGDAQ
jgi:hypothetical protein